MRGSQVVFGNDALRPQGCRRKSTGKRKARREQSRQAAGWGRCRFCYYRGHKTKAKKTSTANNPAKWRNEAGAGFFMVACINDSGGFR